jgi:peptidoglycan/LPS O-acetylase OafA/YrhL
VVGGHRLRTDIQGLRAFAVMAVVLYHLWPTRLVGGFVGVDIFFVISGYLITGHLLREVDRTGSIRLGRFWAARARRLLPAALLVLLLSAVSILLLVPRSLKQQFLSDVLASAAYVQNWHLAGDAVDYLAADNRPSASQHFWSLSVEEQFYVFLPVLVVVAVTIAGLLGARRARTVLVVLTAVTVASFAYSLHLTRISPDLAYFSTFTRMWEFGLGGIAAFSPPAIVGLGRRRATAHTVLVLAGGAAVVLALFVIDGRTAFPGHAALLPVVGTTAILRWGGSTVASSIGALPPVAMLGRISYALYLWHWPLIVIPPLVTLHDLRTTEKLVVLAASLALAWTSTRFFEEPIRFRALPRVRPVVVLGAVLAAMLPVVSVAGVGLLVVRGDDAAADTMAQAVVGDAPRCFGAASMDPVVQCQNPDLSGVVVPDPSLVEVDQTKRTGCWSTQGVDQLNICRIGPKTGSDLHLLAVGDSHNLALVPAYEKIADKYNWRIDVAAHAGCYWTTVTLEFDTERQSDSCVAWRRNLATHLDQADDLDAILVTHATSLPVDPPAGTSREQAIVDGMVEAWTTQNDRGTPIVAIVDNPGTDADNVQCVEKFGASDPGRCATPRSKALRNFDGNVEAAAQVKRATVVDVTSLFCTRTVCPSVIGGVAVYRDRTHVTQTFMTTLAPHLGRRIDAALRDLRVR